MDGLGGGDSAPAVADGKLYGLSNRDGKEIVWALSEADGKEVWVTALGDAVEQGFHQSKEGPGGTPTVDGDHLYVIGMSGRVACLNVQDGKVQWQKSLKDDFGGVLPMWSYRELPLVDGDKVVCTPGAPDATLVALDKLTGETLWKSNVPAASPSAAGTPQGSTANRPNPPGNPGSTDRPNRPSPGNNASPEVTGTKDPALFLSEHWGMTKFSHKVPNGKYVAKLYFAETYTGITGPGGRVFSFDVEGKEFKDFDVWEKAGGPRKAYIESVPVEVTDGELQVTFTRQTDNPAIKAIEIIPDGKDSKDPGVIRIKAGQTTPFTDSSGNVWLADQGIADGQTSLGVANFGGGGRPSGFGGFGGRGGAGRSGAAYSSVIAIDFEGEQQFVQLTASSLVGVSAKDGKVLWQYAAAANAMGINCSTPIFQDGLVFAASAYGSGGGAVKLSKDAAGAIKAEEVYFSRNMQNHHGGMIVVDGALYGANGGNEGGFLTCMDFQTGKLLWRDRDAPKGALLMADGRIYLRAEGGTMLLIEPSEEKLIVRGRFEQPNRSSVPAWAHPVAANGKLYIRDQGLMLCYNIKASD